MIMKAGSKLNIPTQLSFRKQLFSLLDPYWEDEEVLEKTRYLTERVYNTLQGDKVNTKPER